MGRGPLAGPVVAAAVILPSHPLPELEEVRDSKKLSPKKRERLFSVIRRSALSIGVGWAPPEEIDRVNILQASFRAMRRALERVPEAKDGLTLVDGNKTIPSWGGAQEDVVAGDKYSLCIASASVIAKVVRDRWMVVLDERYPGYELARHKGYGTAAHYAALERNGPAAGLHRNTFLKKLREPFLPALN